MGAASLTVTAMEPLALPLVAVTVAVPEALEAVYRPVELSIEPVPVFDQVKAGCVCMALPNWSLAVAVKVLRGRRAERGGRVDRDAAQSLAHRDADWAGDRVGTVANGD